MSPVPEGLREALEQGTLIVCTGPGVATSAGLGPREGLAAALLRAALEREPGLDADGIRAAIASGRCAEALDSLQHVLGAQYHPIVEGCLSDQGHPVPPVATALASLAGRLRAIYTVTLDRLVERALGGRWPSFATPRSDLAQRRRVVFKLRGTLEFRQSWVLTHEQERREFGPSSVRRQLLEAAYRAHHLLLIGFAADDPELRLLCGAFPAQDGAQAPSHFVALESCTPDQRRQLEGHGLQVVVGDARSVLDALGADDGVAAGPAVVEACPYPGLEPFGEALASSFFGRHAEVSQATSRLGGTQAHCRWLSVEGPSGVGKSSFVHAGVIPALRNGFAPDTPARWIVARMRPGLQPLSTLVRTAVRCLGLDHSPSAVQWYAHHALGNPGWLAELVRRHLPAGHAFALVVDQFEEVVTLAAFDERERFAAQVVQALAEQQLYLVTTIRSDFVPALQAGLPTLAERLNEEAERYSLPPISRVGLREAIAEPAAQVGVRVESDLVERILADVDAGGSGLGADGEARASDSALPLVAHMLRGLWDAGAAADRVIELREYLEHGGLMGALSRSADGALEGLAPAELQDAQRLLLGMVRIRDDGQVTRRTVSKLEAYELAGGAQRGEALIARLSGLAGGRARTRLLTTTVDADEVRLDLVHEALLRDWGTLRGWIEQNRHQLSRNEDLDRRARRWQEAGFPLDDLPTGRELRELLDGRPHGERATLHHRYQQALRSAEQARRRRRRIGRVALMASLGVAALVSSGATFVLSRQNVDLGADLGQAQDDLRRQNEELAQQKANVEARNQELAQRSETVEQQRQELAAKNAQLSASYDALEMLVGANDGLARLVVSTGEIADVRADLLEQVERFRARRSSDPSNLQWLVDGRNKLQLLGDLEVRAKQFDVAQSYYEESLELTRALVERDTVLAARDLGDGYRRLGTLAELRKDPERAREYHTQGLAEYERQRAKDPSNAQWAFEVAASHIRLMELGGPSAAEHLQQAKELLEPLDQLGAIAGFEDREAALDRVRAGLASGPRAPRGPLSSQEIRKTLRKLDGRKCAPPQGVEAGYSLFVTCKIDLETGAVIEATPADDTPLGRCLAKLVQGVRFRGGGRPSTTKPCAKTFEF
ncbi:MAG: SIR2 family protein [Myxococcales bacterium]|nr:SIR2 family protein [Myxococcales bacterium]